MANKKVIIDIEVNSDSIDNAVVKTGELKKLSEKISIQYDIDGRPLDVVINKSLNLQQQVKALTAELRKTKEGTAEFQLLSKQLGEAQDGLAKTTAKSKDLFTSLSMIPGPVGQFFGQLQGVIELLKTFSSFTLKDVAFQFKETADDIGDIGKNLSGIGTDKIDQIGESAANLSNNLSNIDTEGLDNVTDSAENANRSLSEAATQGGVTTNTISKATAEYSKLDVSLINTKLSVDEITQAVANLNKSGWNAQVDTIEDVNGATREILVSYKKLNGETDLLTVNQTKAAAATNGMITSIDALVFAEKEATFWTSTLGKTIQGVLIGTGIGIAIVLIGVLVEKLYNLGKSMFEASEQTKAFKEGLKKSAEAAETAKNKVSQVGAAFAAASKGTISKTQALKEYNDVLGGTIGNAETYNEAEQLYNANTANYIKSTGLRAEAQALYAIAAQKAAEATVAEERGFWSFERGLFQTYEDELKQRKEKLNNDANVIRTKADELEKQALGFETKFKPKTDKTAVTKKENENKQLIDKERQLQDELTALKTKGERQREITELEVAAEKEKREVKALKITKDKEALRTQALAEIEEKLGLKRAEINKKYDDIETKKKEEITKKLADFEFNAMMEGFEKQKTQARQKNTDELKELKKLYDDKLITKEQYDKAVLDSNKALNNAIKKIDDDKKKEDDERKKKEQEDKLKKLDDELKFLEMSNETNKNSFEAYWKGRQDFLDKAKERELAELDLTEAQKAAIEKKYAKLSSDLQKEKLNAYLGYLSQGLSAVQSVMSQQSQIVSLQQQNELDTMQIRYNKEKDIITKSNKSKEEQDKELLKSRETFEREQDKVKEKYFYKNRDAQKAQAMISAFQAAISAYSSLAAIPVVGPFLGAAAAAVALAFGIKQANLIGQQQYVGADFSGYNAPAAGAAATSAATTTAPNYGRNYADGGMIGGNRHSDGGTMIEAERGETIMTRGAVTMFQPMLSMMNQMGGGTSFAPSLVSTSYDNPKVSNPAQDDRPMIIKSYVVSGELTSEANKQARLKDLSTI